MKHFFVVAIVFLMAIYFIGCYKDAEKKERSTNSEFDVELLFEKDGIKVYRFFDGGRYIYYTDGRGKTEWDETVSNGKTTYTNRHSVNNVK